MPVPPLSRKAGLVGVVAAAVAAAAVAMIPAVRDTAADVWPFDAITHVKSRHFDHRADAPVHGDLAFVLPDLVPPDAREITVTVRTDDPAPRAYDWRSASAALPADCTAATTPAPALPDRLVSGWPTEVSRASGWSCGTARVVRSGDRFYAWTSAR